MVKVSQGKSSRSFMVGCRPSFHNGTRVELAEKTEEREEVGEDNMRMDISEGK